MNPADASILRLREESKELFTIVVVLSNLSRLPEWNRSTKTTNSICFSREGWVMVPVLELRIDQTTRRSLL